MGYVDISTRISIRWLPDLPSEPSDVLVYNVGSYYLDSRISKTTKEIDWAFAGERQVISTSPIKCRWIHTIDSTGQSTPDEGSFSKLPSGLDLETGSMPCPERNGEITDYEEVWETLAPKPGVPWAWILQSVDGKSFLGKIGGGYLAMRDHGGNGFGVRHEIWDEGEKVWGLKYAVGPCEKVVSMAGFDRELKGEREWRDGDEVDVLGEKFVVKAFEKLEEEDVKRWKDQ